MDRKLKRWECALIFGLLFALVTTLWLAEEQTQLADSVIRLHVIANSDSQADQAVKLAVRDQVLAEVESFYPQGATLEEAEAILLENLPAIEAVGQAVVSADGYHYTVDAAITQCWFPTKEYDDFSLPAGEYTALRITLGEGAGQNWWCVAFPPLCVGAASETVETATEVGLFTQDQAALMTQQNEGYVLKFKSMELLGEFQHWLATD